MRFLVPVVPGDRLDIDVKILKLAEDVALVDGTVTVDETIVARGRLGFARAELDAKPTEPARNA
jgi:3-hydroxymyristoyl/3-hydroxydecanoyl-(acyl carrier protein) dehydratase